jgi:hypothetical protein
VNSDGYYIDSSKAVSEVNCDDTVSGYVEFELKVPKVFHDVQFAAYMGKIPIVAKLEVNELPMRSDILQALGGKSVALRVSGVSFTHIVVMFKVTNKQFRADFPQDQRPTDYANMGPASSNKWTVSPAP